jgi:NADPH2:quinone reductase
MKAVRVHEFGDESVLRYEDAPDPVPGEGEVLVRIRAAAVNRGDLGRRMGTATMSTPLTEPLIIGWDIAGDVVETGAGVTGFVPGQRVAGRVDSGGYAEMVAAKANSIVPIPEGVRYEQAASLPVAYLTAWVALFETLKLQPGETALVQAVSSGVGMAGVQIAKHVAKAGTVFTTAGSDERARRGLELGADFATNYTTGDFVADVMAQTNGRGVDVALDMVGGAVFANSQRALAEGGRLVSVGRSSGQPPETDTALAEQRHQEVTVGWGLGRVRSVEDQMKDLAKVLGLVKDGTLQVIIDRSFPLSETAEAHRHLGRRGQFGKVLLIP